jgi:hypothetical protein
VRVGVDHPGQYEFAGRVNLVIRTRRVFPGYCPHNLLSRDEQVRFNQVTSYEYLAVADSDVHLVGHC